jgi:hypothetical protein
MAARHIAEDDMELYALDRLPELDAAPVEAAVALEKFNTRDLFPQPRYAARQLGGAAGRLAAPERNARRRPVGVFHAQR